MARARLTQEFWCFDIETSTLITGVENDHVIHDAIVYSGQFYNGKEYICVRDIDEIVKTFTKISAESTKKYGELIPVFVHNLSYEFQFLKSVMHFDEVLALSDRQIISANTEEFAFRCSYKLSNMSLAKFMENELVPEQYQKTSIDYGVKWLPWDELPEENQIYNRNDVIGLWLAIKRRIADLPQQDINHLPLTSTGYVRRDARKAMQTNYKNRLAFKNNAMSYNIFRLCKEAFRGGNVHANRFYTGQLLENVSSVDRTSAYIYELVTRKFPTKFHELRRNTETEIRRLIEQDVALLMHVAFKGLRLRDGVYMPYIPTSKCLTIDKHHTRDNGRLLTTPEGSITEMVITEVDFRIIEKQYSWESIAYIETYFAYKKYLPDELVSVILGYFHAKTNLKGVSGREYEYSKSKNSLNATYGMMVTDPIKPDMYLGDDLMIHTYEEEPEILLKEFYENPSSFLSYQTGVWTTAYARESLQELVDITGKDCVYMDTDSNKILNYELYKPDIERINSRVIEIATKRNGVATTPKGKPQYLGFWEYEGTTEFKTFGSKKYIYGTGDDFKITISGVPKKAGKEYIQKQIDAGKLHSWRDLDVGFTFRAVKLTSEYHDYIEPKIFEIDGHEVKIVSNVGLYPCDYTLGYAMDYEKLIRLCQHKIKGENA